MNKTLLFVGGGLALLWYLKRYQGIDLVGQIFGGHGDCGCGGKQSTAPSPASSSSGSGTTPSSSASTGVEPVSSCGGPS